MSDHQTQFFTESVSNSEDAKQLLTKLLDIAKTEAIYSQPLDQGSYTILTASELTAGLGVGFGSGGSADSEKEGFSGGGGGGGGGGTLARPVAAIIIGPEGVTVEPIVDVTKVAIALFTAVGAIAIAFGRMIRAANKS